jgi:ketosteroid isomerase-like protein
MKPPFALPLLALTAFSLLPLQAEPSKEQAAATAAADPELAKARLAELDAYWAVVSKAVNTGDFEAYAATCHPEGVLVSGGKQMSQPLAAALARWKQEFTDTRDGKMKASVEFRFSRRIGDATTAHETGIFLYTAQPEGGPPKAEHIHFEALLVKKADTWKILMENQKGPATEAEWQALE